MHYEALKVINIPFGLEKSFNKTKCSIGRGRIDFQRGVLDF